MHRAGICPEAIYYAETDPCAICIAKDRWPSALLLGGVECVDEQQVRYIVESHPGCKFAVPERNLVGMNQRGQCPN